MHQPAIATLSPAAAKAAQEIPACLSMGDHWKCQVFTDLYRLLSSLPSWKALESQGGMQLAYSHWMNPSNLQGRAAFVLSNAARSLQESHHLRQTRRPHDKYDKFTQSHAT